MIFKEFKWKPFSTDSKYNIELELVVVPCSVKRDHHNMSAQVIRCQAVNLSNSKTLNTEDSLHGEFCLVLDESGYGLAFEAPPVFQKLLQLNPDWEQRKAADMVWETRDRLLEYVVDVMNGVRTISFIDKYKDECSEPTLTPYYFGTDEGLKEIRAKYLHVGLYDENKKRFRYVIIKIAPEDEILYNKWGSLGDESVKQAYKEKLKYTIYENMPVDIVNEIELFE